MIIYIQQNDVEGDNMIMQKMIDIRENRSQAQMAKLLKMTQQQYSNIEHGKRGINPKCFKLFEMVLNEDIHKLELDIFLDNNTSE